MMWRSAICLSTAWLLVTAGAAAQADQADCAPPRNTAMGTVDEPTWRQLDDINRMVEAERYDEAHEHLRTLLDRAGRDVYLQAVLNQALAQVEWARGQSGAALAYFETALRLDALPDSAHSALLYQVAQLYYMSDRLDEALDYLRRWFCSVPAEQEMAAAWVLKASILSRQGRSSGALDAIDAAIELEDSPPEAWFQLKLAAQYELEQYNGALNTLETLLTRWPERKSHWIRLAQTHYVLGQDQEALAAQALAHRQGLLDKAPEILFLAGLYSKLQLPYQAAVVLEQGVRDGILAADRDHWAQVAESWHAAGERERALAAWESAGLAASDGLTDLHRGYLLTDLERWAAALEALSRALARGGLDDRQAGEAYLLRGMAQFRLGDVDAAAADWERAGGFESSRAAARQWLDYLQEARGRHTS